MLVFEFLFFGFAIGGFQLAVGSALPTAMAAGSGAGLGAALGFIRHRNKPMFKRPSTVAGWTIAVLWTVGMIGLLMFLAGGVAALVSDEAGTFAANIVSMFYIRRFFLMMQSKTPATS